MALFKFLMQANAEIFITTTYLPCMQGRGRRHTLDWALGSLLQPLMFDLTKQLLLYPMLEARPLHVSMKFDITVGKRFEIGLRTEGW